MTQLHQKYKPSQQQAFDLKNVDSDIDSLKKEYQYMLENDPFALRVEVKIPENLKEQFENPKIKNFEDSVFSGNYCTGDITKEFLKTLEQKRADSKRNSS